MHTVRLRYPSALQEAAGCESESVAAASLSDAIAQVRQRHATNGAYLAMIAAATVTWPGGSFRVDDPALREPLTTALVVQFTAVPAPPATP